MLLWQLTVFVLMTFVVNGYRYKRQEESETEATTTTTLPDVLESTTFYESTTPMTTTEKVTTEAEEDEDEEVEYMPNCYRERPQCCQFYHEVCHNSSTCPDNTICCYANCQTQCYPRERFGKRPNSIIEQDIQQHSKETPHPRPLCFARDDNSCAYEFWEECHGDYHCRENYTCCDYYFDRYAGSTCWPTSQMGKAPWDDNKLYEYLQTAPAKNILGNDGHHYNQAEQENNVVKRSIGQFEAVKRNGALSQVWKA